MSLSDSIKIRYGLSDSAWHTLKKGATATLITDLVLMVPMSIVILFVADLLGNNEYDRDISLWCYAAVLLGFIFVTTLCYRYQHICCFHDVYRQSKNTRIDMAERMRKLPLSFFSKKDPTDLTVRMMGDVTVQESLLSAWLPILLASLVFTPLICIIVIVWSPILGLAIAWPVPVALIIVASSSKIQKRLSESKYDKVEAVSEMVQEAIECSADLKANGAQKQYLGRVRKALYSVEGAETRSELGLALFVSTAQLVLKLGLATTALVGVSLLINGSISLIVFIAALIIVSRIYDPINIAVMFLAAGMTAEVNCRRIDEIMKAPLQTGREEFRTANYDVEFRNVGFSYDQGRDVLNDVSFTARQGEITALVGPSGGGKSTVARLSIRFWDPDRGRIMLGGEDISDIDPEALMSKYSIVFQDVVLFNTSVMENIRIGRKGATDEEVIAAAKAAMCDEFIANLPDGYDTNIGENGSMLSGGERQRISIARAILKDAPIIIMDEATASLDTESESRVQEALSRLIVDKTVIIIAHRMRTVEDADHVVVLSGGTVAEEGEPDQLREEGGIFARMVELQRNSGSWSI